MKVSNMNNKVKLQSLRDWNKLSNDNINTGTKLVVGFLVHTEATTAVAVKEEPKKVTGDKPVVKTEPVKNKPVVKEEVKKPAPVEEKTIVKEEPKKAQPTAAKQEVTMNMTGQGYFKSSFDQQVRQYPVAKTETVTSGIFNTSNGLQDAKYYLLYLS
ncbi:MAG: LysM peptidoglycan-binding domain-containing protein [Bacteroidota bacterium]